MLLIASILRDAGRQVVGGSDCMRGTAVFEGYGRIVESVYSKRAAVEADKNTVA